MIKQAYLLLFLFTAALMLSQPAKGASITANEDGLKAAFVFRFAQFTTWLEPPGGEFRLCLFGNGKVMEMIERYSGRSLRGSTLTTIRPSANVISKDQCDVAFISILDRDTFRNLLNSRGDQSILLISDIPGAFEENIDIALSTEPNKISFSINLIQAKSRMFSFSGQMLKLAQRVR